MEGKRQLHHEAKLDPSTGYLLISKTGHMPVKPQQVPGAEKVPREIAVANRGPWLRPWRRNPGMGEACVKLDLDMFSSEALEGGTGAMGLQGCKISVEVC